MTGEEVKISTVKYAICECPSQHTEPNVGFLHFALHPLPLFHGGADGTVASEKVLERRDG